MKKKISIFLGILFLLLAGTVYAFQETFDDPSVLNDTWICEPSDLDWSISGGKLRANLDSDHGACYYSGGVAWTDYEIVVPEISLNLGWETAAGVVFRYQNSNNYYFATVNAEIWTSGVYITLEKVVGGSWSAIEGSYFGEFDDIPASVEFKVVVDGESIKVYIDGELKIDTTDADLSNGTVGIWATADFDAMDASWDEFQVTFTSPVCGNGALEPPEVCDDNNTVDCDGCAGDCTRVDNVCGDGILECGEECDDLNLIDGDGCSSACEIELPGPGPTCDGYNVWGWAWSENIGWISFSCSGGAVSYGVNINPATGIFSGYAWSENIGWISFEPADLVGCPSGTCNASVDLSSGSVSGWARALAFGDGWDGWIGLRGIWADGVSISSVPAPSEFKGWAWGDVLVGWISFNCSNTAGACAVSDYKVMTDVVFNDPPYVEPGSADIEYEEYCNSSPTGQVTFRWTYDDNEGDDQAQYNLQVATDAGFNILVVDYIANQSIQADSVNPNNSTGTSAVSVRQTPTGSFDIAYGGTYWWRVKVKDTTESWSTSWEQGPSFSTPSNPYPKPSFTWSPLSPPAEVEVTFTDNSFCYTGAGNCENDADTSYEWDFDYDGSFNPTDWTKGDTVYTYSIFGSYTVRLEVTDIIDGIPRTCYQEEDLTATLPLPTWKEITPF